MNPKQRNFITRALRRLSMMCENRQIAEKAARIAPATWVCACCGDWLYSGTKTLEKAKEKANPPKDVVFRKSKHEMDHIEPAIPMEGFDSWDNTIERLFFIPENWQCLCPEHHKIKTDLENLQRKDIRDKKKKLDKKKKK